MPLPKASPRPLPRALFSLASLLWLLALVALLCGAPATASADAPPAPRPLDSAVDRSTPRKTVEAFLRYSHAGDHERASQCLDLRALPAATRKSDGPTLARDLASVLDRALWIDVQKVSDDPDGEAADGPAWDLLGTIALGDDSIPVAVTRSREGGTVLWQFSKATVGAIPALAEKYGDQWLEPHLPAPLVRLKFLTVAAWQWIGIALALVLGSLAGGLAGRLIGGTLERLARRTRATWDDALARAARGPLRPVAAIVFIKLLLEPLRLSVPAQRVADHLVITLLVVFVARLIIRVINTGADVLEDRLPEDTVGELKSRGLRTQLQVTRRVASILVGVLAVAVILIQFEIVRSVGVSLLASAGILGVVLGVAAQKSLAGIIAGIQLSISQPIRLGDVVVVENETGTIEEINLTFVIVKLWDERRLVMPIARFLEHPFQNWSKMGTALTGTVFVHADPTAPVPALRAELDRFVKAHPLWDGRTCKLQVTDTSERSITLRALITAENPDALFALRCDVREQLVSYLQQLDAGAYLPRVRTAGLTPPS